jgi:hypothetical protein
MVFGFGFWVFGFGVLGFGFGFWVLGLGVAGFGFGGIGGAQRREHTQMRGRVKRSSRVSLVDLRT